jgi:hypothetical protein
VSWLPVMFAVETALSTVPSTTAHRRADNCTLITSLLETTTD